MPALISAELSDWSASTKVLGGKHPIIHAAYHHAWLERIHPFVEGNGRAGRLVLNFMLLQHGHPPAVIQASQRPRYLAALKLADDGNANPLSDVIARAVHDTLNRFLIPNLAGGRSSSRSRRSPRAARTRRHICEASCSRVGSTPSGTDDSG